MLMRTFRGSSQSRNNLGLRKFPSEIALSPVDRSTEFFVDSSLIRFCTLFDPVSESSMVEENACFSDSCLSWHLRAELDFGTLAVILECEPYGTTDHLQTEICNRLFGCRKVICQRLGPSQGYKACSGEVESIMPGTPILCGLPCASSLAKNAKFSSCSF